MKSGWVDHDAEAMAAHGASAGIERDLALRVYTSRLLGRDPKLVLHGGGNTSVKTVVNDLLHEEAEVLCVKGRGWGGGGVVQGEWLGKGSNRARRAPGRAARAIAQIAPASDARGRRDGPRA